jgi:hypothetical protein
MLATSHELAVVSALEAIEVVPPHGHRWMGKEFTLSAHLVRIVRADELRHARVDAIRWRLYTSFFLPGRTTAASPPRPSEPRELSDELSAANGGKGCLDPGWRVVGTDGDRLVVEQRGLRLRARPDELMPAQPALGDTVAVRLPSESPELTPGFYVAAGDHQFSPDSPLKLDRFYLHVREEGAVAFIREATRRLNARALPFRAKVVDERGQFDRCDSALLFFERRDREHAQEATMEIQAALAGVIDAAIPALTRPLAPGLAFAEDPGGAESYGAHRCRLIAEAVISAHDRGIQGLDGRIEAVRQRFAAAGISLDTPYLGPSEEAQWR